MSPNRESVGPQDPAIPRTVINVLLKGVVEQPPVLLEAPSPPPGRYPNHTAAHRGREPPYPKCKDLEAKKRRSHDNGTQEDSEVWLEEIVRHFRIRCMYWRIFLSASNTSWPLLENSSTDAEYSGVVPYGAFRRRKTRPQKEINNGGKLVLTWVDSFIRPIIGADSDVDY
ncbi:unnamed protein product [Nezara viridula]|uniref:Uncharacterized protein n=1 Tax=Nezara viridula TaxID=85310 RepID=A0A9P0HDH5_NEZVI|nr:unnamed protein product [Nezara viridula]